MDPATKKTCLIVGGVSCLVFAMIMAIGGALLGLVIVRARQGSPVNIPFSQPIVAERPRARNLAEARANMEEQRRELVDSALNDLSEPLYYEDDRVRQALLDTKEESIPWLITAMGDKTGKTDEQRLNAGMILLQLNHAEGFEVMKEFLESDSAEKRVLALDTLGSEWLHEVELKDDLISSLVLKQMEYGDTAVQESAVWACHILEIEGREAGYRQLFDSAPASVKEKILNAVSEEGSDPVGLEWLAAEIAAPSLRSNCGDPSFTAGDLDAFLASSDEAVASRAREILKQYVEENGAKIPEADTGYSAVALVIADHGDRDMVPILKRSIKADSEYGWVHKHYLKGIARIEGAESIPYLRRCVNDPRMGALAFEALADAAAGTEDEGVVSDMIRAASRAGEYPHGELAMGLLRIGGDTALGHLDRLLPKLDGANRLEIMRIREGRTLESELREIVKIGLLPKMPDQAVIDEAVGGWDGVDNRMLLWKVYAVLGECGVMLKTYGEAFETPPPYDLLLREYAEKSGGLFSPDWTSLVWEYDMEALNAMPDLTDLDWNAEDLADSSREPAGIDAEVLYESRGVLYRFQPRDQGNWYDMDAITDSLNNTLEKEGRRERFVAVKSSENSGTLLIGDPETARKVAEYLGVEVVEE